MTHGFSEDLRSLALIWRFVGFAAVFLINLIASPFVAQAAYAYLPRSFSNWFYFWPQMALVSHGFTVPASDTTRTVLGGGASLAIAVVFWASVGLALAWLLRNRRVATLLIVTVPVSFAVGWFMLLVLGLANVGVQLDGP